MHEAYPLAWPLGQARTPAPKRRDSRFDTPFARARDELLRELALLGAHDVVISTNVPTRRDGLPYAAAREPDDPGVAVYFTRRVDAQARPAAWTPFTIACDTYTKVRDNLRAVGVTVEALRTIQRHGASSMLEQAFSGFAALPAPQADQAWWEVLGVTNAASVAAIKAAHAMLARRHHPDVGGDTETMARINRARDAALAARGG